MTEDALTVAADPRQRRKALIATIVMVAIGALGFFAITQQIAQINGALDAGDGERAVWLSRRLGAVILVTLLVACTGLAYALEQLTRQSLKQGRYPPQGIKVLQRTRVRTGKALRAMAITMRLCAAALLLLACGLSVWFGLALNRIF